MNRALIEPDEKPKDGDCVAVIVAFPDFIMVTVRPDIDITSNPEASVVNVKVENVLVFDDIGFVKSKGGEPNTRGITTKFDNTGGISVAMYIHIYNIVKPQLLSHFCNNRWNCCRTNQPWKFQIFINIFEL